MCFKKNKIDDQPAWNGRTVSGIVVGNYPGTVNDLAGPVPDFDDLKKEVLERWPDMNYREFKDSKATRARFLSELREAITHVGEDGMLFFIMDTCHAESSTRNGGFRNTRRRAFRALGYDKVLVFSSSLSSQTSADAQFPGGANGAWHYALLATIAIGITYRQWFDAAKDLLAKLGFSQIPVIEGPEHLQNRLIFEGNVATIQVSAHGGQVDDLDGDMACCSLSWTPVTPNPVHVMAASGIHGAEPSGLWVTIRCWYFPHPYLHKPPPTPNSRVEPMVPGIMRSWQRLLSG